MIERRAPAPRAWSWAQGVLGSSSSRDGGHRHAIASLSCSIGFGYKVCDLQLLRHRELEPRRYASSPGPAPSPTKRPQTPPPLLEKTGANGFPDQYGLTGCPIREESKSRRPSSGFELGLMDPVPLCAPARSDTYPSLGRGPAEWTFSILAAAALIKIHIKS